MIRVFVKRVGLDGLMMIMGCGGATIGAVAGAAMAVNEYRDILKNRPADGLCVIGYYTTWGFLWGGVAGFFCPVLLPIALVDSK